MRMKTVKVLDDATEVWYLIGRPEPQKDMEMLESTGWGVAPVTLLVRIRGGGGCEACMSAFRGCIEYDLEDKGPMDVNGTSIRLVTIVRNLEFEEIPTVLDVRKFPQFF